jgi:hypothetical protein
METARKEEERFGSGAGLRELRARIHFPLRALIIEGLVEDLPKEWRQSRRLSHAALTFYVGERLHPEEFVDVHDHLRDSMGADPKYVCRLTPKQLYTINHKFGILKRRIGVKLFSETYAHLAYLTEEIEVLTRRLRGRETVYQLSRSTVDGCGGLAPIQAMIARENRRCALDSYLNDGREEGRMEEMRALLQSMRAPGQAERHRENASRVMALLYRSSIGYYRDFQN